MCRFYSTVHSVLLLLLLLLLLCRALALANASPEQSPIWAAWTAAYGHESSRDAQTDGHGWAGLTELQGVTVDFWGGPSPLAGMYREQLCRGAR